MDSTESRVTVSAKLLKTQAVLSPLAKLTHLTSRHLPVVFCCFVQQMSLKRKTQVSLFLTCSSDNIWTDQNLLLDPDLPTGWRTIRDSTGTYYWHVPTGATQWHHPRLSGTPQLLDAQVQLW